MLRLILIPFLLCIVVGSCSRQNESVIKPSPSTETKNIDDLRRVTVEDGIEVTFYPAYGFRSGDDWVIPTRTWVHKPRPLKLRGLTWLAKRIFKCDDIEESNLKLRLADFPEDDESNHKVIVQFNSDSDNEKFFLGESDRNGLIQADLKLPDAKARRLLENQGSSQWLTYRAVSTGHIGKGRIQLIDPTGVSVITDIDDTIKVTEVPAEKAILLRNTFCREFIVAPGMADRYLALGDSTFHYVSGGPWQLFGPLYDFLITGTGKYPEGSFHFGDFPKNPTEKETLENIIELLDGSLEKTYNHKVNQITDLLKQFPARKFILVGDSGELDPEVYRTIKDRFPTQIQEIWIRDVVNDAQVNPDRLAGMERITVEPIICTSPKRHEKLAKVIKKLKGSSYAPNKLPPCPQS